MLWPRDAAQHSSHCLHWSDPKTWAMFKDIHPPASVNAGRFDWKQASLCATRQKGTIRRLEKNLSSYSPFTSGTIRQLPQRLLSILLPTNPGTGVPWTPKGAQSWERDAEPQQGSSPWSSVPPGCSPVRLQPWRELPVLESYPRPELNWIYSTAETTKLNNMWHLYNILHVQSIV